METPNGAGGRGFRSLTTRLIVWTLVAVGAVYLVTVLVSNSLARSMALAAAEREAVNESDALAGRVQDILHAIEYYELAIAFAADRNIDSEALERARERVDAWVMSP